MVEVRELVRKHKLDKYPNVIGYSNKLRPKIKAGKELPIKSIRIYVRKKVPESELSESEVIPKEVEGIKTDVIELGHIKALGYKGRYRPAPTGISTSRLDEDAAGTIGWWMVDEDGNVYLISNNHVWAKNNNGVQGDKLVQPGVLDGGTEDDVIATLYDFIPLDFSGGDNKVDVALAKPVDMTKLYTSIMELGGITGKRDPQVNDTVCKVGRSTGKTCGTVSDDSATLQVDYEGQTANFTDVFVVTGTNVCEAGDSGSPILDKNSNNFLGLLFAGSDDGSTLVGCKQSNIESALQNKLGKKIWILIANAWPPFRTTTIVQEVYPSTLETMGMSSILMVQLALSMVIVWELMFIIQNAVKYNRGI